MNNNNQVLLKGISVDSSNSQLERLDSSLRTYATWLVRAARRKLADSEASESPDNSARIDLTSEGNRRTNTLVDNGLSHRKKDGEDDPHSQI